MDTSPYNTQLGVHGHGDLRAVHYDNTYPRAAWFWSRCLCRLPFFSLHITSNRCLPGGVLGPDSCNARLGVHDPSATDLGAEAGVLVRLRAAWIRCCGLFCLRPSKKTVSLFG